MSRTFTSWVKFWVTFSIGTKTSYVSSSELMTLMVLWLFMKINCVSSQEDGFMNLIILDFLSQSIGMNKTSDQLEVKIALHTFHGEGKRNKKEERIAWCTTLPTILHSECAVRPTQCWTCLEGLFKIDFKMTRHWSRFCWFHLQYNHCKNFFLHHNDKIDYAKCKCWQTRRLGCWKTS